MNKKMKKIGLYTMALLSMGLVACNQDFETIFEPQTNLPESKLQTSDVSVATSTATAIDIASFIDEEKGTEAGIPIGTVTVKEGAMPANTILKAKVEFSKDADFANSIIVDANSLAATNEITVQPSVLEEAYFNNITRNPATVDMYTRTVLYTVTGGNAEAIVGEPGKNYYAQRTVKLTPLNRLHIAPAYYIVGQPNGWSNSAEGAVSVPFTHSDLDVYDDPIFTVTFDASYNEDGSRADVWFSILSADDVDAFVGGDWNVLLGNTKGNGTEDLSGMLQSRYEFGKKDNNMKMPAADGASQYQVTINMEDGTYEIIPLSPGAIFDTDPVLYLTGDHYDWGGKWLSLTPVHSHPTISWTIIYLHEGEQFKFAPQAGWGNDFGMNVESVVDNAGMNPSGDNNIVVGNAGWYLIKVDNTEGARKVEFLKPNVYLIGNTATAGWSVDDSGLFQIPAEENGLFVSPAFVADDEVRMCVKLDDCDWWQSEFVVTTKGQIDFRGAGDDQARVKVKAGQKCYLNFATGGGQYK